MYSIDCLDALEKVPWMARTRAYTLWRSVSGVLSDKKILCRIERESLSYGNKTSFVM